MQNAAISEEKPSLNVIYGQPEGQDARTIIQYARDLVSQDGVAVHVALDDARAQVLIGLIEFFAPDADVVSLPAWDCLPYDRVSPNADIVAARVNALSTLLKWNGEAKRYPRILIMTVNAALQKVMPRNVLDGASFTAAQGGHLDLEALTNFMSHNGYTRTQTVREPGEYAVRGSIVDLFPSGYEEPLRIDLFGDEIESIRRFDPVSQVSGEKVKEFSLRPVSEFFLNEESIARFRAGYRDAFGVVRDTDPLYEAVSEGRRYNGMEHWLPLFYEEMNSITDYIDGPISMSLDHHALEAAQERIDQIKDFYSSRKTMLEGLKSKKTDDAFKTGAYHPIEPEALYHLDAGVFEGAQMFSPFEDPAASLSSSSSMPLSSSSMPPFSSSLRKQGSISDEGTGGSIDSSFRWNDVLIGFARKSRDFADIRSQPDGDVMGALREYVHGLQSKNQKIFIAAYSEGASQRLQGMIEAAADLGTLKPCANFEDIKKLKSHQAGIGVLELLHGFVADDLAVITEADILGDRLARKIRKKRQADNFLTEVSSLDEGDLVVHVDHGIGRFLELETLNAAGTFHDCLKIEYAGGDKLYVPVENMDVLSRFGADEGVVQLDKLGGAGWQSRKAKAKKDLMIMADQLLKIAAARQLRKADRIELNEGLYNEFASRFPYQETEDQLRAINSAIEDLGKSHPMDRLICGDVGFGKTEVALRAAYVAAMDGHQVAVVVPTTLLARQHYNNFKERFAGTGLRVEQLSRLVSAKDTKAVHAGLTDGSVNIVIGTHALFGSSIKFNNLGLLIIDEEQRFGVKQKERLKELKNNVHVLTMTATPIPRTLQMSLTGVKEMSLITTPPVDRLAVRTFVMPFDGMIIREALLREHYRGGQSFYVCPRIKDMKDIQQMLTELVPEVRVMTAHGQMSPEELEDKMTAFYDGQFDVLLATNIIESGIDIPSANTMIVHRADMFGLAQLYQIRGRIGRSKVRAYAYLTYQPGVKLNPQAMKRLEVIETLDTLGSGFQLASHDMDIRGAGNLLGDAQSGHIKEIGVELYQQMLEDAVAAAREGTDFDDHMEGQWSPAINLGTSVLIPETYVEDLGVRMSLYRRLADLGSRTLSVIPEAGQSPAQTSGIHKDASKAGDITGSPLSNHPSPMASGDTGMTDDNEIEAFAAELIDRFGRLPEEVQNLLDIVSIKQLCKKAGIDSIEAGPKGAVIGFHNDAPPNVERLMGWMTSKAGAVKLRHDQKLVVIKAWDKPSARVAGVKKLVAEMAQLGA